MLSGGACEIVLTGSSLLEFETLKKNFILSHFNYDKTIGLP